jgi:hypothetical protein
VDLEALMNEEVTDINELISVINNIQVYKTSASAIYKIYGFREHYLHHHSICRCQKHSKKYIKQQEQVY